MSASNAGPVPPLGRRSNLPGVTAPDGSEVRFLADSRQDAVRSSLVEVTLRAGEVTRPIWHRTVEEIWYVLEGDGKVWRCHPNADPETAPSVDVAPGDVLVIRTGWRFQFSAGPDSPLRFLCHTTPPWPGEGEAVPAEWGGLGEATV